MEIKINIDLEAAIAAALRPEALQPVLDKHIVGAITGAISDATGYRSEFSTKLKEQVASTLPHGLGVDDVVKFQQVLNAALTRAVQSCNEGAVQVALAKAVATVMPDVPASLKMSDLLAAARDGFHKDSGEAFYAYFEPSSFGENDGGWLYLDEDEKPGSSGRYDAYKSSESRKYSARHRLAINGSGDVYALRLDGKDITPVSCPDIIGRFDALLMGMYVGRTKLEIDISADDVESAACAQYD
jgi:hypothetical protein